MAAAQMLPPPPISARARFVLALLACLALPRLARAQVAASSAPAPPPRPPPRVALLEIRVVGLSPDVRGRFLGAVTHALRSAGYDVVETDAVQAQLRAAGVPPGCSVGGCLRAVGRALGAARVVTGGIGAAGSNYDITLTLLDTDRGIELAQSVDRCEVCTLDEGLATMIRAAGSIAAKVPVATDGQAARAQPPPAGPSLPGPATPGGSPDRGGGARPAPRRFLQAPAVRWTAAGAAVAALGTGVALWALDGGCAQQASNGACRSFYDTAGTGLVLIGAGVALGAGGVWLFYNASADQGTRVAIGWGGRF